MVVIFVMVILVLLSRLVKRKKLCPKEDNSGPLSLPPPHYETIPMSFSTKTSDVMVIHPKAVVNTPDTIIQYNPCNNHGKELMTSVDHAKIEEFIEEHKGRKDDLLINDTLQHTENDPLCSMEEDCTAYRQRHTVKMEDDPAYAQCHTVKMEDDPAYVQRHTVKMEDDPAYVQRHTVKMEDDPAYIKHKIMKDNPACEHRSTVKMENDSAYGQHLSVKIEGNPTKEQCHTEDANDVCDMENTAKMGANP